MKNVLINKKNLKVICDEKDKTQKCCAECLHSAEHIHGSSCYFSCFSRNKCRCVSISEIRKQKLDKLNGK